MAKAKPKRAKPYHSFHWLRRLRKEAYLAQAGKCYWCGEKMLRGTANAEDPLYCTAEHLIPRYLGGKSKPGNVVAACAKCNNERNTETNRTKIQSPQLYYSAGDDTPRSPFEVLKNGNGIE